MTRSNGRCAYTSHTSDCTCPCYSNLSTLQPSSTPRVLALRSSTRLSVPSGVVVCVWIHVQGLEHYAKDRITYVKPPIFGCRCASAQDRRNLSCGAATLPLVIILGPGTDSPRGELHLQEAACLGSLRFLVDTECKAPVAPAVSFAEVGRIE